MSEKKDNKNKAESVNDNKVNISVARKIIGLLFLAVFIVSVIGTVIAQALTGNLLNAGTLLEWTEKDLLSDEFITGIGERSLLTDGFIHLAEYPLKAPLVNSYHELDQLEKYAFFEELLPKSIIVDLLQDPVTRILDLTQADSGNELGDIELIPLKAHIIESTTGVRDVMLSSLASCNEEGEAQFTEFYSPVPPSYLTGIAFSLIGIDVYRIDVTNPNNFTHYIVDEISLSFDGEPVKFKSLSARPVCSAFEDRTILANEMSTCYFEASQEKADVIEESFVLIMRTELAEDLPDFALCVPEGDAHTPLSNAIETGIADELSGNLENIPDSLSLASVTDNNQFAFMLSMLRLSMNAPLYLGVLSLILLISGSLIMSGKTVKSLFSAGIAMLVAGVAGWLLAVNFIPDFSISLIYDSIESSLNAYSASLISSVRESAGRLISSVWQATTQNWIILSGVGVLLIIGSQIFPRR